MALNYCIKYFPLHENSSILKKLKIFLKQHHFVENENYFDYLFIVGGDGTFLKIANQYLNQEIKIIMINDGNIGFFSSCEIDDLEKYIFDENKYVSLDILQAQIDNSFYYIINEITTFSFNALPINIKLNQKDWYKFYGSGFIVATPLGSSGSNKSNYGPLIDPNISCFIFSEILSVNNLRFSTLNSPIVFSSNKILEFSWEKSKNLQIAFDNHLIEYKYPKIILGCLQTKAKFLVANDVVLIKWKESFISRANNDKQN